MTKPLSITELHPEKIWAWWIQEIRQVIPSGLLRLLDRNKQLLALSLDHGQFEILHLEGSTEEKISSQPIEAINPQSREEFSVGYPTLREHKVCVRLSKTQGLRRTIRLPLPAEENLQQVIGLEMDRISPFKQDQVYFACRVIERDREKRQLVAQIVLAPRQLIDDFFNLLESGGWRASLVFLEGEAKPWHYNLIPEKFKPKPNALLDGLTIGFSSLLLASFILALILPVWMTKTEISQVQTDLKRSTKIAKEVEAMKEESDRMLQQAKFLQLKKRSEPILVDALEELSRVIPDDTWLNGLQCTNHRVVIQGQSPSASSLLKKIEGSRFFRDVSFVSPVTKDSSNGLERFQIAFDLVNGRYSEEVH